MGHPHAPALRCNAPQRTPRFPDTAWGRLRQSTGWSLRALAEKTGLNPGTLSRIENGRACASPDEARRLLDAFDRSADR